MNWDYKIIRIMREASVDEIKKELNQAGKNGWELVGIVLNQSEPCWIFFFKRQQL